MCTRFYIDADNRFVRELKEKAEMTKLAERFRNKTQKSISFGEKRPADIVPVLAPDKENRPAVFPMQWGFRMKKGSLLINARSETAGEKITFAESWKYHRCIIPSSCYFEWKQLTDENGKKKTGDRFAIKPKDSDITYLAGIYRIEDGLPVFVVLTREPSEDVKAIHDRMPLIFSEADIQAWMDIKSEPGELLLKAVTDLSADMAAEHEL